MIRPVARFGDPVLSRRAEDVLEINGDIERLIDDMAETMCAAPGIGLAAPQVGVPLRLFVIDLSVGRHTTDLIALVNPTFVEREGMQLHDEGCLSLPGFSATVARPSRAVVRGLDRRGAERVVEGSGLLARALQHEMDHLEGLLFIDRLRGIKRDLIIRKVRKLTRRGQW